MSYMRVKQNWIDGLWTEQMVRVAYRKGVITQEQLEYILSLPQKGQENN